jgi:hypothetical protein
MVQKAQKETKLVGVKQPKKSLEKFFRMNFQDEIEAIDDLIEQAHIIRVMTIFNVPVDIDVHDLIELISELRKNDKSFTFILEKEEIDGRENHILTLSEFTGLD